MISDDDFIWVANLMRLAASDEILPRFRRLEDADILQKKSSIDLVTEADTGAERLMTARLRAKFPSALVVGEEAFSEDESILDGLANADLAFVLDPVDGTYNFARGVPLFGVMCAIVVKGVTMGGIIYDPMGGDWIMAQRGAGAFMRRGSDFTMKSINVAEPNDISEMTGGCSWYYMPEHLKGPMLQGLSKFKAGIGFRCAAHEYWLAASGGCHFLVYNNLNPWDHLAGALIHQEAGGYHARFDGSEYDCATLDGGLLMAPDHESWQLIHAVLLDSGQTAEQMV